MQYAYEFYIPGCTSQCGLDYILRQIHLHLGRTLRWSHNGCDSVSNHQPHDCLLNRLFRRRWKKISKLRVTGFCAGNSPGSVNSTHKRPVTRKMFPFDDVIMMIPEIFRFAMTILKHLMTDKFTLALLLLRAGAQASTLNRCHTIITLNESILRI